MKAFCFVLLASLFFIASTGAASLNPFLTHTRAPLGQSSYISVGSAFQIFGVPVTGFYTVNTGAIVFVEQTGGTTNAQVLYSPLGLG